MINFKEFLVLPYFMERFVIKCLPEMSMLDYKVDYSNHKKFNSSGWYYTLFYTVLYFTVIHNKLILMCILAIFP